MNFLLNSARFDFLMQTLTDLHIWDFIWYPSTNMSLLICSSVMLVKLLGSMIFHNIDASQHNVTTYMHKFMSLLLYALWFAVSSLICFSFILRPINTSQLSISSYSCKKAIVEIKSYPFLFISFCFINLLIFSLLIWVWYDAMKPIKNPSNSLVTYLFFSKSTRGTRCTFIVLTEGKNILWRGKISS